MSQSNHVVSRMHVVIPDDYQNAIPQLAAFKKLKAHDVSVFTDRVSNIDTLAKRWATADVLVPIRERTEIDDALLERLPRLKLISQSGKGVAHIDVAACTRRGVAVAVSGGYSFAPAELTWALVLAAMRALPQQVASAKAGRWQAPLMGTCLKGRTLGIYGYGGIGKIVAGYGAAFGMRVVTWGRATSLARAQQDGHEVASDKAFFFGQCDVLSLHLRLTPETTGVITAADLAVMKPTSVLVNTSRADLIERGALEAALRVGRPGYAAVDVYEAEPATDHPLFHLSNAICAPHLGYLEKDTYEIFFGGAFDNVLAFASGSPTNLVNPDALNQGS